MTAARPSHFPQIWKFDLKVSLFWRKSAEADDHSNFERIVGTGRVKTNANFTSVALHIMKPQSISGTRHLSHSPLFSTISRPQHPKKAQLQERFPSTSKWVYIWSRVAYLIFLPKTLSLSLNYGERGQTSPGGQCQALVLRAIPPFQSQLKIHR